MADLTLKKRRSGTMSGAERITGVKNAQAEMVLLRKLNQFQTTHKQTQQKLKQEEYQLEHESRLLMLDSKRNDLEYKKRLYPNSDLSYEEMSVNKLKKYLVTKADQLCYLDKGLGYNPRKVSNVEKVPSIVMKARLTIRHNEIVEELNEARQQMYSFMRETDTNRPNQTFITHFDDEDGDLDAALKNNQNVFPEEPDITARPLTNNKSKKTIREQLEENPLIKRVFDEHRRMKAEEPPPSVSPTTVLNKIARMKPLTKNDMMKECLSVQENVHAFNTKIEQMNWTEKQEEFQQGLKFIKDKDAEWNKFLNKMNSRLHIGNQTRPQTTPNPANISITRPTIYAERRPLTQRQKRLLLIENVLIGFEKKPTTISRIQKGIPYHTANRAGRGNVINTIKRADKEDEPAAINTSTNAVATDTLMTSVL